MDKDDNLYSELVIIDRKDRILEIKYNTCKDISTSYVDHAKDCLIISGKVLPDRHQIRNYLHTLGCNLKIDISIEDAPNAEKLPNKQSITESILDTVKGLEDYRPFIDEDITIEKTSDYSIQMTFTKVNAGIPMFYIYKYKT